MSTNNSRMPNTPSVGLAGIYIRMGVAVLIGAGLAVGIYFLIPSKNAPDVPGAVSTPSGGALCVCPACGATIEKPNNLDCEEVNCPHCGNTMGAGAFLPAAAQTPTRNSPLPMTQNARETLAERGMQRLQQPIQNQNQLTQNARETLAEQGMQRLQQPIQNQNLQPAAVNPGILMKSPGTCVCPICQATIPGQSNVSCTQQKCPRCSSEMLNSIPVGQQVSPQTSQNTQLAAMVQTPHHQNLGMGQFPQHQHLGMGHVPQHQKMSGTQAQQPDFGGAGAYPYVSPVVTNKPMTNNITYTNTIQPIISQNCLRCHSGPMRNLSNYDNVKTYVNSGLLTMMVQPGGPMSRFLSADESSTMTAWIKAGAPN